MVAVCLAFFDSFVFRSEQIRLVNIRKMIWDLEEFDRFP